MKIRWANICKALKTVPDVLKTLSKYSVLLIIPACCSGTYSLSKQCILGIIPQQYV